MPINNTFSLIGGAAATILVFVLTDLLNFFNSGRDWPTTTQGWLAIILPALCAGLLAVLTPHYAVSEVRTGARLIDTARGDAPVYDKQKLAPPKGSL
jgi:hypothetical protein